MNKLLVFLSLLLFPSITYSADLGGIEKWDVTKWSLTNTKFVEVKELYIDYMHYTWAAEPFLLPYTPTNRLDLHMDLEFVNRILFMNNMVHSETDQTQYRLIGWNYKVGVHITDYLDFAYEHFSQHILDAQSVVGPNSFDSIGVRLYIYKRKD